MKAQWRGESKPRNHKHDEESKNVLIMQYGEDIKN